MSTISINDFESGISYFLDDQAKTYREGNPSLDFIEEVSSDPAAQRKTWIKQISKNKFVIHGGTCSKTYFSINPSTNFLDKYEQVSNAFFNTKGRTIKFKSGPQPAELFRVPTGYTLVEPVKSLNYGLPRQDNLPLFENDLLH